MQLLIRIGINQGLAGIRAKIKGVLSEAVLGFIELNHGVINLAILGVYEIVQTNAIKNQW